MADPAATPQVPAPDDHQIRDDYLAGRGAVAQAQIDRAWAAIPSPGAKATPGAPEGAAATPPRNPAIENLPLGKRIMTVANGFLNALGGDIGDIASGVLNVAKIPGEVYQHGEPGSPEMEQQAREFATVFGARPVPGGIGMGAGFRTAAGAATAEEAAPGAAGIPLTLGERVRTKLAGEPEPAGAKPAEPAVPKEAAPAGPQRDFLSLGDPLEPAVTVRPTARNAAQAELTLGRMPGEGEPNVAGEPSIMSETTIHDYLAGARVDNPVKINLARIGSGDDIAETLAAVSKTIPEQAVQSNDATVYAAHALGMSPDQFLAGYKGTQLNAAETTAMRFMLDSSAQQLINYAKAAREPLAAPEAQAEFLKAFTVHRSLQQYFENAKAEAGRTLQSWNIMSQAQAGMTRAVGDLLKHVDRQGDLSTMADQIADMDNPLHVSQLVAQSMQTGRDRFMTAMYNVRLSSPTTIVKKLTSDVGMTMLNLATRGIAETVGRSGEVIPGETGALLGGYINSFTDAIRAGGKALKAGESQFWRDYGSMDSLELNRSMGSAEAIDKRFRLSALANGVPDIPLEQPTRGMFEYIRSALPTSWIGGADDFAKVWQYRANLRSLAWRASGGDENKFQELLDTTPQWIHQQALDAALKYTFQEPLTGLAAKIRDAMDTMNVRVPGTQFDLPVGRILLPFIKVPANIARMAYRTSPLPFILQSPAVRQALANPGAERDILLAQMGLGTAASLGIAGLALNGNITGKGPLDPGLRREWEAAGHQPYSLELPGARPIQYNWFEPMGMVASGIADTHNLLRFAKDHDAEQAVMSLAFGIGQAGLSKTYYSGMADFLDAVAHPDPDAARYTSRLMASFVPQGVQRIASATDDWYRAHYNTLEAIEANLPIVRQNLPPQRTLWGDPVPTKDAYLPFMSGKAASVFSPAALGPEPESAEPIDRWIFDNREAFPHEEQTQRGIQKLSMTQTYPGGRGVDAQVKLSPQEYDRLQVLAGNELKDPGTQMGAKDVLNALVEGQHPSATMQHSWNEASPSVKALMVQSVVSKYRKAAKEQIRQEFSDVDQAVQAGLQTRAQQLTGAATR